MLTKFLDLAKSHPAVLQQILDAEVAAAPSDTTLLPDLLDLQGGTLSVAKFALGHFKFSLHAAGILEANPDVFEAIKALL